jgi:signal transduction histidine kinase/DNA-binding NarL/FixJ family response regulator
MLPHRLVHWVNTRVGSFATVMAAFTVTLGAILWLIALGFARSEPRVAAAVSATLWAVFVVLMILAGIVASLFTFTHGRQRAAEQESRRRTAMLEDEIAAHTQTGIELQRMKEVAEMANEAKTRYLVAVSHEIRSPLNAIYGYAQLLERDDGISGAEAGTVIRRSAEHLTNLVEGLLEISRIESGVVTLRPSIVDLRALFDGIVDMFRMQAAARGLTLNLVLDRRVPRYAKTDEKRLRQMLINLISNAIKYTDEGGATITVGYRSQVADIEVRDTGIGIAGCDIERIFQPFERGNSPESKFRPGIGLGLAITRALARILGGDIVATSTPGHGSSFRLRLLLPEPLEPPAGTSSSSERIVGYEGPRRTILVIDDDAAQRTVMQTLLRPLGFEVHAAGTGAEGIALAERDRVDLVLLDIQMPGMSGWETAERLRVTHDATMPIVMVSANAHEFRAGNDGNSAHDGFITKPVDFDALLGIVCTKLGLTWQRAPSTVAPSEAEAQPLPPEAAPYLETLRQLARIGHVRGIERTLDELAEAVPSAAALVAMLRRHTGDFDLRLLVKALDDAGGR